MRVGGGRLAFPKIFSDDQSATNAAPITVTPAETVLVTLNMGTRQQDDRIFIMMYVEFLKDVTADEVTFLTRKDSGTAVVESITGFLSWQWTMFCSAGSFAIPMMLGIFRVTTPGTLTLRLSANCVSGNGDVATGKAILRTWILRGR